MTLRGVLVRFWPLLALQLVLMIAGLLDISRRKVVKYLPRAAWVVIIILGEAIGPVLYFAVGRGEE